MRTYMAKRDFRLYERIHIKRGYLKNHLDAIN